jgi:drug/metabolite transporter (DMT)-like permease
VWSSNKTIGMAMGLAAALVGGGWQVATRGATTGSLPPADLVILRYGVPALLLLPVWWRIGAWPAALAPQQRRRLPLLVLCAGLPFGAVAMWGSSLAPSAHMGVWMAGASPIVTALLAWGLWRERPDRTRLAGLALMLLGVGLLALQSLQPGVGLSQGTWRGDLLFLLAATLWSGYTLAFRGSGLTPWQGAALVNLWSFLGVGLWLVARGGGTLHLAPVADIAWQALWQGLFGGVLGLWTFSVAIERLGAAQAAAFAALAPMVSSVGGWWFLGDPLGPVEIAAVAAAVAGVLVVNGAWPRWRPAARDRLRT